MKIGMKHVALSSAALVGLSAAQASAAIVTFDAVTTVQSLPYAEAGLTFTNIGATNVVVAPGGGGDGYLTSGTNVTAIGIRVSSATPFDLRQMDIESLSRTWTFTSSSGATLTPAVTGGGYVLDFTVLAGWTGITYFDMVHNPPQANGSIRIDNLVFAVPEPSAALLPVVVAVGLLRRRRV